MKNKKNDILQGTLTLLVLRTLERLGPCHGYGLCSAIQSNSEDLLRVEEGSLYPALHRMKQQGWLRATWGLSDKGRRAKFYEITALGRRQLAEEQESWERLTRAVALVLRPS
ncbi:MAG: PadR family transcriptional regulator [Thermoanaerobaculia bacterium]|nr:PadR family transcriptional regulator [Thermoanaerobaculia bacterium]